MPASLHILASRVVKRAIKHGAVIDPIEHYGDIHELDRLAREIVVPPIGEFLDLLDAPIVIEDIKLRRLSWSAQEWLSTSAWDWWNKDAAMLDLCYAWAMAHARDKEALQSVRIDQRSARKIIQKWARGTSANYDAVMAACRYLSPKSIKYSSKKKTSQEDDPNYIGSALLTLLTESDRDLDYWIFEAPNELVSATLARIRENLVADRSRMIRALGREVPPDPFSWHVQATRRFSVAAGAFIEKVVPKKDVSAAMSDESGVGPVEPVIDAPVIDDQASRVDGSQDVDKGGVHPVASDNPSQHGEGKEQQSAPGAEIHDLRPSGDDQGSNPVVR